MLFKARKADFCLLPHMTVAICNVLPGILKPDPSTINELREFIVGTRVAFNRAVIREINRIFFNMRKLSNSLKRILTGLAYQDAGEFLSTRDKIDVLGDTDTQCAKTWQKSTNRNGKSKTRRIALITDGRGIGAALDYAIDVSQRQGAQIDLLVHGAVDVERISTMEKQIHAADVICHRIQLYAQAIEDLFKYIAEHSCLMFVVASPDDTAARQLVEDVIPNRRSRISVPLVLIDDQSLANSQRLTAA